MKEKNTWSKTKGSTTPITNTNNKRNQERSLKISTSNKTHKDNPSIQEKAKHKGTINEV